MVSLRRDVRAMAKTGDDARPSKIATKVDFRSGNGGMAKRPGQYTIKERLDIIEDLDAWRDTDEGRGRSVAEFVRAQVLPDCFNKKLSKGKYGWRFPSTRAKLVQLVADGLRKICRTRHSKPKFPLVESLLIQEMKAKRTRGKKVSERWMRVRSKQLMKEKYPEAAKTWKGSQGYQRRFCRRVGFVPRRVTNHRSSTLEDKLGEIKRYHKTLRVLASKQPNNGVARHPKWGRWKPHKRLSGDQVPIPFVIGADTTWELKGAVRVAVKTPSEALKKRQCTLHVTFSPDRPYDKQPRGVLVFRGKGKRISAAEQAAYHPRIAVIWQDKAWVDRRVALETVELLYEDEKKAYGFEDELLWLGDNLEAQTTPAFKASTREKCNGTVWHYPAGCSDKGVAPVDNGLGAMVKHKIGVLQEIWLEDDDNMELWESNQLSASNRRVLISNWVGDALEDIYTNNVSTLWKYFEGAGALMTIDGTGDDKIRLEGWPADKVYTFMDVEVDAALEEDLANMDDLMYASEGEEPEVPDSDEEPEELQLDGVSADPDELDMVEEDPVIPDGYEAAPCPDAKQLNKLSRHKIMFRWEYGWNIGLVKNRHGKSDLFNYFVQYTDPDDGVTNQYRQGLFELNYYDSEICPDGAWFLITKIK
jgi:hypothetical protein